MEQGFSLCIFPFQYILRLLKIKQECVPILILIAPVWGTQPWYPELLKLWGRNPVLLPKGKEIPICSKNLVHPLIVESPLKFRIITKCRWKKTLSNYESHWRKWVSWCLEQKINSFQASVKEIIEYLTFLFNYRNDYRAINLHRSAISDFHEYTDGLLVGNDPSLGFVNWCLVYLVCL